MKIGGKVVLMIDLIETEEFKNTIIEKDIANNKPGCLTKVANVANK